MFMDKKFNRTLWYYAYYGGKFKVPFTVIAISRVNTQNLWQAPCLYVRSDTLYKAAPDT